MPTELAQLMTLEMGKPVTQAKGEIELSAAIFEYYATKGPDLLVDEILDIAGSGKAIVRTAPIGALLGVMPWNFPYYQAARFVAPNLLLGNTILLKHAANCPQQALRLAEMLEAAGAPNGVYQNVFATTDQVATMIASPAAAGCVADRLRTRRQRGGRARRSAHEEGRAGTRWFGPVHRPPRCRRRQRDIRCGGRQIRQRRAGVHVIEADDRRILGLRRVPARVRRQGRPMAARRSDERRTPSWDRWPHWPRAPTSIGQVEDAVAKGATVHLGGQVPDGPGAFYPATVLTGVTPEMRAYREELFGPVAVLYQVDSVDEAIAMANDSPYRAGQRGVHR